jgi:probable HAF family extracellular repeat protein
VWVRDEFVKEESKGELMKFEKWTCVIPLTLLAALAISHSVAAQDTAIQTNKPKHHTYKLIDIGTFGGPNSIIAGINSSGAVIGEAETPTTDPFLPHCFNDCVVNHAIEWHNGVSTDLGALPGVNDSFAFWINDLGRIAGVSENGLIDPLTGFPEVRGVYWKDGKIIDLGTFGGNASYANAINNAGQIVGMALNTIPDSYSTGIGSPVFASAFPVATQFRAFLWQNGAMHDLGTLGGNAAQAVFVNDRGQVIGVSYTNAIADPSTGFPIQDPFFWENGEMTDIGSLGGASGYPAWINNRGQVVGASDLGGYNAAGILISHGFFWDKKDGLRDIGTLGGTISWLNSMNDNGEAVGMSSLAGDQVNHALLWKDGNATDLGVPPGMESSYGLRINAKGQIIGGSGNGDGSVGPFAGWLWENGGPMVDLNQLIVPGSDIIVTEAQWLNDRGEITCIGVTPNGDIRGVILIPNGDCDDTCEARIAESQNKPGPTQVNSATKIGTPAIHGRFARRFPPPKTGPNN